jgi:osmotically-inducible protein OsmY
MISHLRNKVAQAIEDAPHLNRQHLRFETCEGRVILRGIVASYFQKQMAQEAVRRIDGVRSVTNELEVSWS